MKKILFLLLIGGGLLVASCTKQYNQVVPNQTVYSDIPSSSWTTTDTGKNYTVTINTPEIDQFFTDHGGINVYFTFNGGQQYEQIPEVYNNVSFTYTYTAGGVTLYAQSGLGNATISAPDSLTAKIVLVPSN
jgi:hypothetical protein